MVGQTEGRAYLPDLTLWAFITGDLLVKLDNRLLGNFRSIGHQ
jgi:hypothetical protein